jgi:glycosyltransferase involved in cell wall biosynthesis
MTAMTLRFAGVFILMLVARVIAKLEPGGGVASRLLVGEATPEGRRLLREAELDFEVWGGSGEDLQYACDRCFVGWLRPRLADADLVHGHMFGAWWAASEAALGDVPLAASEHNAIRWPGSPRLAEMRRALARVDACFAHGPSAAATVLDLGLSPARLHPAGSAIEQTSPMALPRLPRPRLIFAGRLHPEKGPDLLLEALARLREPVPAYLLGGGPLARYLPRRITALGLEPSVKLVGWQRRVGPWLAGASVCVVPSRAEAWSQTAVTAMAHRVPVVATSVEGLPLTLAKGRGVLVAPDDPARLASAISAVLAGDHAIDLDGAQRYAGEFSPSRVAVRYAQIYRGLLGASGLVATHRRPAPEQPARAAEGRGDRLRSVDGMSGREALVQPCALDQARARGGQVADRVVAHGEAEVVKPSP